MVHMRCVEENVEFESFASWHFVNFDEENLNNERMIFLPNMENCAEYNKHTR